MCLYPYRITSSKVLKKHGVDTLNVPCGRCFGCRLDYSKEIEFLSTCEMLSAYEKGLGCSFCTLTYNDENLPLTVSDDLLLTHTLRRKDFQDFLKRFRIKLDRMGYPSKIRFIGCGEYGDGSRSPDGTTTFRPHYHLVLFGVNSTIADDILFSVWDKGLHQCGNLRNGGIRYVSKYLIQSKGTINSNLLQYDSMNRERPFFRRSSYLGYDYLVRNYNSDCFPDGSLLPKKAREVLGYTNSDALKRIISNAKRDGYSDVSLYVEKMRRDFVTQNVSRMRMANIPIPTDLF